MEVSQRGYFTTRVLTRPVASILLAALPNKIEKLLSPNKISFSAFLVAQISNLVFFVQLSTQNVPIYESLIFWIPSQYAAYVLDCADGQFARQHNQTSIEGKILDMILDLAREVMRLLLFAYFLIELKYGFIVIVYLALRIYWMSTWASIYHLDSLQDRESKSLEEFNESKKTLTERVKSGLLLCFSVPQDGFLDIFVSAFLFTWVYTENNFQGSSFFLLSFLIVSILTNIFLVFRRISK